MKVKASIKRICGFCEIVRRGKYLYVRCQKFNRHKQRQGFSTLDKNVILDKEKFCECESLNGKKLDISPEEEQYYNIIEEDCECCNKSTDKVEDIDLKLEEFKMI